MLMTLREFTLLLHLLFGMTWFGGIVFIGWGIYPILVHFNFSIQRELLYHLMKHVHLILFSLGFLTITTGIILGVVLGPITSIDFLFETRYGNLFLSAFSIATVSLLWGTCVSFPFTLNVLKNHQYFNAAQNGIAKFLNQKMRHIALISGVEVVGLLIVIYIMILF